MGTGSSFITGGRYIGGPYGAAARFGMRRATLQSRMRKHGISRAPRADISASADISAGFLRHCILLQTKANPLASSHHM
jgi:hypothetical protein